MSNLSRLGDRFTVTIPPDPDVFIGRECPDPDCGGYFKIQFGSGLKGHDLPCHCAYCGHTDGHNRFLTKDQLEYAKSVVANKVTEAMLKDLKKMEFRQSPRGDFGIGVSLTVHGRPYPVRYYREQQLETEVVCAGCSLRYAIYGVFGFCPDCGVHNSRQILEKNLELAEKECALSAGQLTDLAGYLVADALEDCVSAFDGFAREAFRVHAERCNDSRHSRGLSFQDISGTRKIVEENFGFDFAGGLREDGWVACARSFQKRHLLAHKMGVVDEKYLASANDPEAELGRKVRVTVGDVEGLIGSLKQLSGDILGKLAALPCVVST